MNEPLNSQTTTTISATSATPTPALRASGWKPLPGSPPFLPRPKNAESLRVKSRHISSRSGGPSWPAAMKGPSTLAQQGAPAR